LRILGQRTKARGVAVIWSLSSHNRGELLPRTGGGIVILERTGTQRARVRVHTRSDVPRRFLRFFVRFPRPGCVRWLARGARNTPLSSPHNIDVNPRPRNLA